MGHGRPRKAQQADVLLRSEHIQRLIGEPGRHHALHEHPADPGRRLPVDGTVDRDHRTEGRDRIGGTGPLEGGGKGGTDGQAAGRRVLDDANRRISREGEGGEAQERSVEIKDVVV